MLNRKEKNLEVRLTDVFTDIFVENLVYSVTKRVLTLMVALTIISFVLFNFVFSLSVGSSMCPNIPDNSIVIAKHTQNVKRGDIIIFKAPEGNGIYTKRVIGEAGDIIDIKDNRVYINNEALREDYIQGTTFGQGANYSVNYKVENDEYYVLGDNREDSFDSRHFGTIKKETVVGKVIYKLLVGEIMDTYNIGINHFAFILYMVVFLIYYNYKKRMFRLTMRLEDIASESEVQTYY